MVALPTGTVTFFFSDIEGSTRLLEALGRDYSELLARHNHIVRDAFARSAAVEIGTEGDSFFAVFPSAGDAVTSAVAIQRAIAAENWPSATHVRVRIGVHSGEAQQAGAGYVGLDVHRAARIMSAAHGGQILISEPTRALVERSLSDGITLRDLGEHRLRDLTRRERLYQVVAHGLTSDFPPPRSLERTPNNLPMQTTELVGRDDELQDIREQLQAPGVRLMTLTGPGGIGKTRLALQAAADESDRFEDGVYFVDLADARDAASALQAIVRAVGITVSGEDQRAALAEQLGARHLFLLLDNFEQVMSAAADVAHLIRRCPRLTVLVTSREALRIHGERVLAVAPLSLPEPGTGQVSAAFVADFAAVHLFVERAHEAQPTFRLTDDNAGAVAEICRRLDGLPLAIELAAARLKLFSPVQLRDRLRSRLELLRGGARDLPPRQQTLRSTIEWSYELLDDDERATFQVFSVFASATVDAIEEVAATLESVATIDVVARLESLVDKSLIRSVEERGIRRLAMLDTIREFAAEQLETVPALSMAARRAHALYFAEFAHARHADRRGGRDEVLDDLASELANLQAAWRYFVDDADLAHLGRLLDPLWAMHEHRGWYHGAVALANDLLEVFAKAPPTAERAEDEITIRMTLARGLLALRGWGEDVAALYEASLALAEGAASIPKRLPILRSLASLHLYRGEIDKTAAIGRDLLRLGEQTDDTSLMLEGHLLLGPALAFFGDVRAGLDHLDRAIALFDPERHGRYRFRLGPSPGVAARAVSALVLWLAGQPETASHRGASAIDLATTLQHPYSLAYATFHVGLLDLWSGRFAVAHERASSVLTIASEHDYPIWTALGLVLHGVSGAALGRAKEGLAETVRGISLYQDLRTPPVFWPQILGLKAYACALAGRTSEALSLLEEALQLEEGSFDAAGLEVQKADLLVQLGQEDEAEALLRHAAAEAQALHAPMIELRALTRLARVERPLGHRPADVPDAQSRLRHVFETFTEGFDSPDLLEARAALDEAATLGP
jgi:predicted ATPase/class 3 adenylate cyclase